jgi:hypothetical protein
MLSVVKALGIFYAAVLLREGAINVTKRVAFIGGQSVF